MEKKGCSVCGKKMRRNTGVHLFKNDLNVLFVCKCCRLKQIKK